MESTDRDVCRPATLYGRGATGRDGRRLDALDAGGVTGRRPGPPIGPDARGPDDRGLTAVVGLMLLIGLVALASAAILFTGAQGLTHAESTADDERIERGFQQLGHEVDTVGLTSADRRSTELDLRTGTMTLDPDAGKLTVERIDRGETLYAAPLTALVHEDGDRHLAYQAGGVWRGQAAETQLVSAPSIGYWNGSLSITVVDLAGSPTTSSDRLTFTAGESTAVANATSTRDAMVRLTVESPYYGGWAAYFEDQLGPAAVRVDDANETVEVVVGRPTADGDFSNAVVAAGDVTTARGNPCVGGDVVADGTVDVDDCDGGSADNGDYEPFSPIDEVIAYLVDRARETADPLDASADVIGSGTYVANELHRTNAVGDLTIDVSAGDVTVVVDGHVGLDNAGIEVVGAGSGNAARVYVTGDVAIGGGKSDVTVSGAGPEAFQLYGTSQMHYAQGQSDFTGTIYAPRTEPADGTNEAVDAYGLDSAVNCADTDVDVCFGQGSGDFTGSIVSGDMQFEQSTEVRHDPSLDGLDPELVPGGIAYPPDLKDLELRSHEVAVSSD